jgi:hypothetical protein
MRRRGLEPLPTKCGPSPQPGNAGVRSVLCVPECRLSIRASTGGACAGRGQGRKRRFRKQAQAQAQRSRSMSRYGRREPADSWRAVAGMAGERDIRTLRTWTAQKGLSDGSEATSARGPWWSRRGPLYRLVRSISDLEGHRLSGGAPVTSPLLRRGASATVPGPREPLPRRGSNGAFRTAS